MTGIDIVKEQFAIASGRKLRWTQDEITLKGHAIECRISAENPYNNFLPAAGRITRLGEPTGPGVRLESGIYAGWEVSLYYDPLLAKLVVWGETRPRRSCACAARWRSIASAAFTPPSRFTSR